MTIFQAIVLGVVQGLTEFLPISSSGHLVLTPALFGWEIAPEVSFLFNVWVQLGTLLAVIVYFWKDLWGIVQATVSSLWRPSQWALLETRLGVYLIIATIPAVIFGIVFNDAIEAFFAAPRITAWFLLLTAGLLLLAEWVGKRKTDMEEMHWYDALIMGVFQALALLPGVSRSGATITGGMLRNLTRPAAARFSFLMSVPVMLGAAFFTGTEMFTPELFSAFWVQILVGMLSAAVVGFVAIRWLLKFLATRPVSWFSGYLVILAVVVLLVV